MLKPTFTLLALISTASLAFAQADEPAPPATAPATRAAVEPATQAVVVPDDVKPMLDQLNEAAAQLKGLAIAGRITFDFKSDSDNQQHTADFTAAYRAPSAFRHEAKDDLLIVSGLPKEKGAAKGYAFLPSRDGYSEFDPPKKGGVDELPDAVVKALIDQDPLLLLLISGDPQKELLGGVSDVKRADNVDIDGASCPALTFEQNGVTYRFAFDPSNHLVRQVQTDETRTFKDRGVDDVRSATVTIDYTKLDTSATPDDATLSYQPPKDAIAMKLQSGGDDDAGGDDSGNAAAMAMVGKAAPDFSLKDLQGKPVSLAALKGQVVVLDFWATWCGPCVAALPHLEKLHQEKGEQGVKVLAVNQEEKQPIVQKFVDSKKLTMTVLLDSKADVGKKYHVDGIPQTVVIGRDGKVKKVIIGFGGDDHELRDAVDKAMGQ